MAMGMLTACHVPGLAGLPHPISWRKESNDGRYVLVMVSPLPDDKDKSPNANHEREIRAIRATYRESGLYRNDGSRTPLWMMPYFDWTCDAFIAPDGIHLVVLHNVHPGQEWMNVWFFARGKETASHDLNKLVPLTLANRLVYRDGPYCEDCRLNEAGTTFTVRTNYEQGLLFDVASGKLIRRTSPWPARIKIFLGAFTAAISLVVFALFRRFCLRQCQATVSDARP